MLFQGLWKEAGRYFGPSWYSTQGVCVWRVSDGLTSRGVLCSVTQFMSVHVCSKPTGTFAFFRVLEVSSL